MDVLALTSLIEFIRFAGNLNGTFYIDDVRLITGAPQAQGTVI